MRPEEDLDLIFARRELRKVSKNLVLHYERKLYVMRDIPENRRLIGKYVEVFAYLDGRIEIRVARLALPYALYSSSGVLDPGVLDQGAIVENKRLSHALQTLRESQARREEAPSPPIAIPTHGRSGTRVLPSKIVASRRFALQRRPKARRARNPARLTPLAGRQTARSIRPGK